MIELHCGDCLDVLAKMAAGSVDHVITDPPYGIPVGAAFFRQGGRVIADGSGTFNEGDTWGWFAYGTVRPGGSVAVFHRRQDVIPDDLLVDWWHRYYIVKQNPPPTPRPTFASAIEECEIGTVRGGKRQWYGSGAEPNRWIGTPPTNGKGASGHPAEKPLEAIRTLLRCLTRPGDTVLDPFMGSGTTGVACVEMGRNFIGIELDPSYFAIAEQRIANAQQRERFALPLRSKAAKQKVLI